MTARHVLNKENGFDNTLNLFFSLQNEIQTYEKDLLLVPFQVGEEKSHVEKSDPLKEEEGKDG